MHFNTVLLDLDGTLIDPRLGITRSIQYALEKLGKPVPLEKDLLWTIGPPLRDNLGTLLSTQDTQLIEQGMQYYRERFGTVGLFENEVYPGIPETLTNLKLAGVRLFLATSKPQPYAYRILEHFNLLDFFNGVYGSEFNGMYSDKRLLIEQIVLREKLFVPETIMVGDRMFDVAAAKYNHMAVAGVTYGYGSIEELETAQSDYLLTSPEALISLVKGHALV